MIDVERQITHWREGAKEDMVVGSDLIARQKPRHGLFFVHLADVLQPSPTPAETSVYLSRADEVFQWLISL